VQSELSVITTRVDGRHWMIWTWLMSLHPSDTVHRRSTRFGQVPVMVS
jgi:hypothetical protein